MEIAPVQPTATKPPTIASRMRGVAADTVRGLGDGAAMSGSYLGVAFDEATITPVEAGFELTKTLSDGARRPGLVGRVSKLAANVANIGSFVGAFYSMITSGMIGATGATISDLANGVADRIDGGAANQAADGAAATRK